MKHELLSIPDAEYFALEALSNSGVKEILKTPAHFKAMSTDTYDSRSLRVGTAVHQMVLGGDNVAVFDGASLRGKAFDQFKADNRGKRIMIKEEWDEAEAIANSLKSSPVWCELVADAEFEVVLVADDGEVKYKCKADAIDRFKRIVIDLKTTSDIHAFERSIFNYRYDIQDAWYTMLFSLEFQVDRFIFAAVESSPPYALRLFELDDEVRENAREDINRALELYRRCRRDNHWPSYEPRIERVSLPRWMQKK
jgi:exodeoxyribonuclease VIII